MLNDDPDTTVDVTDLSTNIDLSNKDLKSATTLTELEAIYKALRGQGDAADNDDVMLIETAEVDYQYSKQFLIDWRAKTAMVCFIGDRIPVESLAFPYIFWRGGDGTFGNNKNITLLMSFAEYVKIR